MLTVNITSTVDVMKAAGNIKTDMEIMDRKVNDKATDIERMVKAEVKEALEKLASETDGILFEKLKKVEENNTFLSHKVNGEVMDRLKVLEEQQEKMQDIQDLLISKTDAIETLLNAEKINRKLFSRI